MKALVSDTSSGMLEHLTYSEFISKIGIQAVRDKSGEFVISTDTMTGQSVDDGILFETTRNHERVPYECKDAHDQELLGSLFSQLPIKTQTFNRTLDLSLEIAALECAINGGHPDFFTVLPMPDRTYYLVGNTNDFRIFMHGTKRFLAATAPNRVYLYRY